MLYAHSLNQEAMDFPCSATFRGIPSPEPPERVIPECDLLVPDDCRSLQLWQRYHHQDIPDMDQYSIAVEWRRLQMVDAPPGHWVRERVTALQQALQRKPEAAQPEKPPEKPKRRGIEI
jgi:hypothetical protein